jgi:tetratricopeptide (TPR) repeat protein
MRIALATVTGLAPLLFLPGLFDFANLPQSAFLEVSAAGLLAAALAIPVWRTRARRLEWPPLTGILAAWLVWSALASAWSPSPALALRLWMHWLAAAAVYLLLFHLSDEEEDLRPVAAAALAAGAAIAVLGLGQHVWGWTFVPQAFPPAATFANKNIAAQFAVGVLPFALAWMTPPRRGRWRAGAMAATVLLLAFVAVSRTRSAAVAAAVEALVLAAWWGRSRKWVAPLAVAAAVLVMAVAVQQRWTSARSAAAASVQGRIAIWRNTLVMIREHPLTGVGLGAHASIYPAYHRRAVVDPLFSSRVHLDFAHNDYLQLTAELGLMGAVLLAALAVGAVRLVRQARARAPTGDEGVLAAAATAAAAGLLADALFSFPAYRALPPWLLALDAAILAVRARGPAPARGFLIPARRARQALTAVAAVAGIALAVASSRWLRADGRFEAARRAESKGDWARMASESGAAVALDAARADAWFSLGTAALVAGEPAEAARALQEAVARDPFNPSALANLGLARAKSGDRAGAVDALRRASEISPAEGEVAYQLGRLLQGAGDGAAALQAFGQAAAARPSDARAQYRRGLAALSARRLGEAEEALRAAIGLDPSGANAHKALGVVLLQRGRRDEAVTQFREALRLDPAIADRAMMERVIADSAGPKR